MSVPPDDLPRTIAIAGAWGYIGRKFLDVALARGLTAYVYDPGPMPPDLHATGLLRLTEEAELYSLRPDLFHLALHPEHRRLDLLLARREPLLILNEKPMALPGQPRECDRIVDAVDASTATVLYDFPELYDPLTARILALLARFRDIRLTEVHVRRSKDREDPANPRNFKRMVSIQYQESVHCLAFVLYLMAGLKGSLSAALADGVRIAGESEPYEPPNPEAYPESVDGRCRYRASFGDVSVVGITDFKRGAPWAKRRVIRGLGDGRPFLIEVSYLERAKSIRIDGVDQPCDPRANSYEHVLATSLRWSRQHDRSELMTGLFPGPRFARLTYLLSSALWQSCRDREEISLNVV